MKVNIGESLVFPTLASFMWETQGSHLRIYNFPAPEKRNFLLFNSLILLPKSTYIGVLLFATEYTHSRMRRTDL